MRTSALVSGSFREMLLLLCVQLFLASVFTFPSGDYWEDWGPYGECSRSCGGGVTARSRHCVTTRKDGGHSCVGPEKSYRSCNVQDCPEGSKDFREEQCSQFDGVDFQGKQYRWLPYYGGENPCELNCIPRGESFYYRHKPAVVDGTPCHPQGKDICVDGLCKPLGCDQMLESPQKEDPCLQCGGYGQTCTSIRNVFSIRNLPKGYNQIFTIPVGATSLSIKESVPTRNYFAIKNLRGEYYLNGHWLVDFSGVFPMAGTVLFYQRGSEGEKSPEIITARGPITEPLVIELITQEANQGVEYEYYLLNGGLVEDYYWSYGSWSSCSKECGLGYQSRVVFCTFDDEVISDARCAPQPRPLSNRTCNEQLCPQIRRMAFVYQPRVWRSEETQQASAQVFSWVSSEWLPCPVTCGGALQTRQVECVLHDDAGSRTVEDSQCSAYTTRPVSQQRCSTQQCAHYSVRHWSQCSVTCGLGKQTREVLCIDSDGASLEDYKCGSQPKPPRTQECEMPVCRTPIGWHIGDWGMCSKSCGSGLRERQVICSDRQRNLHQVEVCQVKPKPSTVESCNKQHCSQPQEVPSMQDPTGHDNTAQGFLPFLEDSWPEPPPKPECILSPYGCCSDGRTPAKGPQLQGCAGDYGLPSCTRTRFGCCRDGVSAAHGPAQEGCPDSRLNANPVPSAPGECELSTYGCCYDGVTAAAGTDGEGCSEPLNRTPRSLLCDLPYAAGSCDQWTARYYYDRSALRCSHFWYGGCHGNSNNFITEQECQRKCLGSEPLQQDQAHASNWQNDEHMIASHNPPRSSAFSMSAGGVSIDQSDPSSVEGQVGQRVLLLCRVTASSSSSSELMLEWRRDGNPVDPRRHQQRPDGSLVLAPVTRHDSGWFLCVATKGQERDHRYVYLSVSEDSKEVETPEVDSSRTNTSPSFNRVHIDYSPLVEAREGQTARLQCLVFPTSAMHSVTVHWSRGEHTLNFLRYSQHSDGTLVIKHVRSEDSGSYSCTVTHALWTEERQIQLRVFGELKMLEAPSDVSVLPGHSAQLFCRVTGEDVRLGWSRNGVLVRGDGRRVLISADGTLTITDVRSGDEGKYSCNAYTGTSSISATAELRLDRSPQEVGHQDCVDQPELANCELVVYTRLCSNQYFSSFCCASCTPYSSQKKANDA